MVPPPSQGVRPGSREGIGSSAILGSDPRVLVIAPDDELIGPLCQGLDALGWRTITARSMGGAVSAVMDLPVEAVILDARADDWAGFTRALKRTPRPCRLPVIAFADCVAPDLAGLDLAMTLPPHPAQAALRLEQLIRGAIAEEEVGLREATFAARGAPLVIAEPEPSDLRILAAGKPDHRFLALSNALTAAGCEVVAAPTPYTAFDYLHERAFDAVVLWGGEDHAPAQSIASGMKRNTRLYHIPAVLYVTGPAEINLTELYGRGFADVATADTPEEETAARILALARTHRRHQAIRKTLEAARHSGLTDPATGLFTPALFASHLSRVTDAARARRRPLSVCVLRIIDTPELAEIRTGGWLQRALPQLGAMVSRLIRVEDTAARLSADIFALALPATTEGSARITADRIAAVIGCTAFDAGSGRSPFVVGFEIGVAEMQPGESPADLLDRASDALTA